MNVVICTLFEGNYAQGAGALVNSLAAAGFRGKFYAGFRGTRPDWDVTAVAAAGIEIKYVELDTTFHFTNFKPDWMLQIFQADSAITHVCYLDPDIVLSAPWAYMIDWLQCGIALCEDINSPVPASHPRRIGWRRFFAHQDRPLTCRTETYVNGGFVGLAREHSGFLELWRQLSVEMGRVIGGLETAKLQNGRDFASKGFANCFDSSDQDALNATVEASQYPLSICGKSAMAFEEGETLLPHALGRGKPWERKFIRMAFQGIRPRRADKAYFAHVSYPVRLLSDSDLRLKRIEIGIATAIGRVWSK